MATQSKARCGRGPAGPRHQQTARSSRHTPSKLSERDDAGDRASHLTSRRQQQVTPRTTESVVAGWLLLLPGIEGVHGVHALATKSAWVSCDHPRPLSPSKSILEKGGLQELPLAASSNNPVRLRLIAESIAGSIVTSCPAVSLLRLGVQHPLLHQHEKAPHVRAQCKVRSLSLQCGSVHIAVKTTRPVAQGDLLLFDEGHM